MGGAVYCSIQRLVTTPVLDYEHQTLVAEFNGFFYELDWREGSALFGTVELPPALASTSKRRNTATSRPSSATTRPAL